MKRSILIVDDELDMLQLLKRSLAPDLNCKVQVASSGETALQMLSLPPILHPFPSGSEAREFRQS